MNLKPTTGAKFSLCANNHLNKRPKDGGILAIITICQARVSYLACEFGGLEINGGYVDPSDMVIDNREIDVTHPHPRRRRYFLAFENILGVEQRGR